MEKRSISSSQTRKVQIYTYHFPDGRVYVGYTSRGLDDRHREHKRCSLSPIYEYLKTHEKVRPRHETSVEVNIDNPEIYDIQRNILDKYTTDTNKILNKNLILYNY